MFTKSALLATLTAFAIVAAAPVVLAKSDASHSEHHDSKDRSGDRHDSKDTKDNSGDKHDSRDKKDH